MILEKTQNEYFHSNTHGVLHQRREQKFKSWNKSYKFWKKSTLRLSVSLDCANQNEILEGDHSNQDQDTQSVIKNF